MSIGHQKHLFTADIKPLKVEHCWVLISHLDLNLMIHKMMMIIIIIFVIIIIVITIIIPEALLLQVAF